MLKSNLEKIPYTSINIGERFRVDHGNLEELAHDIYTNGLISPIAVTLDDKMKYTLVAGGRRMAAIKMIRRKESNFMEGIPANVYEDLTELELRTIEAAENFKRQDMNYAERVALMAKIHELQIAEHGVKIARNDTDPGWNQTQTAKLLSVSKATVAQDLELAKAIKSFPDLDLDKCKNKKEASKRLNNFKKTIKNRLRADEFSKKMPNLSKAKKQLVDSYMVEDFFTGVKKIPDGIIDLVEIDSPYGIDLKKNKGSSNGGCSTMLERYQSYNEVSIEDYANFTQKTLKECYRTMAPNSWLLKWFAPEPWFELEIKWLREAGFEVLRMPCIWAKGVGQTKQFKTRLANSYEMFFYARKGEATLATPSINNLFNVKPIYHEHKTHPTERPIDLLSEILSVFARPNSTILVPFLGSGNTILAAFQLKMRAFGFELSRDFKDSYIIKVEELF